MGHPLQPTQAVANSAEVLVTLGVRFGRLLEASSCFFCLRRVNTRRRGAPPPTWGNLRHARGAPGHQRRISGGRICSIRVGILGGRIGTRARPQSLPRYRSSSSSAGATTGAASLAIASAFTHSGVPSSACARYRRTWGPEWPRLSFPGRGADRHDACAQACAPMPRGMARQNAATTGDFPAGSAPSVGRAVRSLVHLRGSRGCVRCPRRTQRPSAPPSCRLLGMRPVRERASGRVDR